MKLFMRPIARSRLSPLGNGFEMDCVITQPLLQRESNV